MPISPLPQSHPVAEVVAASQPPLRLVNARPAADSRAIPRISSQALLEGGRELVIQHQGGEYRLRVTRNDKLILTK